MHSHLCLQKFLAQTVLFVLNNEFWMNLQCYMTQTIKNKTRLKCDFHSDKPWVDFDDGNPCSCLYLMVQYLFVLQFHLISEKKKFVKTCPDFTRKGYTCRLQTLWQASSNFLPQQSNFNFKFSSSLLEIWTPLKIWPHRRD